MGYHLRTFSLQRRSMGEPLQTVALPNCPFVTSVQFAPLSFAVLIGYGRCQAPAIDQAPQYAVLRCIAFAPSSPSGARRQLTEEVAIFSVDSTDESNVALFHPHPHACAQLGFLYATKDGRIRAFRFDRDGTSGPPDRFAFVPFVDMANHHSEGSAVVDAGDFFIRLRAARDLAPGDAVTISYGAVDRRQHYALYGYWRTEPAERGDL